MNRLKFTLLMSLVVLNILGSPAKSFGLNVGDKAPSFIGNSTKGKIQLADYLGRKNVVLALYFAAFTPV